MKTKDKNIKAKKAKVIKKNKNHKNKKKSKKRDQDSDLSDFEPEITEELPQDVSFKVQQLLKEANEEIPRKKIRGTDFLENDPLVSFDYPEDSAGFLPEFQTTSNTSEIWSKLNDLSKTKPTKENVMDKLRPVYNEIGIYLSRYKSGGLPKAFKVLPKMTNWSEIIQLTNPQNWTPNAMYEVTRLFSSNMNESNAEIFYLYILLPAVRENLASNKTLNHHYYESLMKAMFKPTAWFKGILLPLVQEGCTYREGAIIGSVLKKISIPVFHVSAFIIQICQYPKWFGSTSFILTILFQKKYKLPIKVIGQCLQYFYKFVNYPDHLPVIWHQSLYLFLYNYQHMLNEDEYKLLRELLGKHKHPQIGPAIEKLLSCTIQDVDMKL
uniref:Bystin, putative n=1 Tax=Theileria annulata TaxID=5874 RepID=A0A3B0MYZ6_THEAN